MEKFHSGCRIEMLSESPTKNKFKNQKERDKTKQANMDRMKIFKWIEEVLVPTERSKGRNRFGEISKQSG